MPSRANKDKDSSGEDFEVLERLKNDDDYTGESLLRLIKQYINEGSNPKQLAFGGASGW